MYGYRVLEAANGEEALSAARNQTGPIYLLCADVDMLPGIDGLTLARRFKLARPEAKVLYVTGGDKPAFPLLRKPFTDEELIATIREILDWRPLARAAENHLRASFTKNKRLARACVEP